MAKATAAQLSLSALRAAVTETIQAADFLENAKGVSNRISGFLAFIQDEGVRSKAIALTQPLVNSSCDSSYIYQGLIVRLSACLEEFLRKQIASYIDSLNDKKLLYAKHDRRLLLNSKYYAGRSLQTIHEPIFHHAHDYDDICIKLGTSTDDGEPVLISTSIFTSQIKGISEKELTNAFQMIGMKLDFDKIGQRKDMQTFFAKSKTRETANACREKLESLVALRNSNAHTGIGGATIQANDLKEFANFVHLLAEAIADQIK
jgi:hypothetical protein